MNSFSKIVKWSLVLAFLALPLIVWLKWNALYDWYRLRNYTPSSSVVSLASQDTMTAYAKHLFYVNHTQLVSGVSDFRQSCPENEQAIVLGCYHPPENGIFIYNVSDKELAGVQQVTAAHEMLHAAYGRLSSKDRSKIDNLLDNYYQTQEHNQRIIDEINLYKQTEPNSVMDEMHSVLGTEEGSLTPELETYYSKYFSTRSTVIAFADAYQGAFTSRSNQVKSYDAQLASLKSQISTEEQNLKTKLNQINSDRARLDSQRNSGDISGYNSGVDNFNAEVNSYNAGVSKLQSDITNYNSIVKIRNEIAAEIQTLDNAIDTRLTPQTTQ